MASNDQVAALVRKMHDRLKEEIKTGQELRKAQSQLEAIVRRIDANQGETLGGRLLTARDRILARTHNMQTRWFVIEYTASNGGTAADTASRTVDTTGFLVVDRIWATWRATSGNDNGTYGLISSAQAGDPDHTSTNIVDFTWVILDGASGRRLANVELPCDILARQDGCGFPAGGLVLTGGSEVTIELTPLRAWPSDGVLSFIFEGIQAYDQVGAP